MNKEKVFTGRTVKAKYTRQILPEYSGNPMIEALPPILGSDYAVAEALRNDIRHGEADRQADAGTRRHMVQRLRQFWEPQTDAIELERLISTLVRGGYVFRNPANLAEWHTRLAVARKRLVPTGDGRSTEDLMTEKTTAHSVGMSLVGLSGVGKTTAVRRILSTYPQVIEHGTGRRKIPVIKQLVWLLVTCPEDGGTPALCRAILAAFDAVMGTAWATYYTERGSSAHAMRTAVTSLAHSHALGLLVIDEIQLLKSSRTGNARMIMGFLLALMNDLDVPVLLVGTREASRVLDPKMQNARRFIGNGGHAMEPLRHEDGETEFADFVGKLWDRTVLREMGSFDPDGADGREILRVLHHCTAGVHDLVVKMFLFGQVFALRTGMEILTPAVFEHVYDTDFAVLHRSLERLRHGELPDDEEWSAGLRDLRKRERLDSAAMAQVDRTVAALVAMPASGGKAGQRKAGGRGAAAREAISAEKMDAGLADARALLGTGVLGVSLLRASGDVVR